MTQQMIRRVVFDTNTVISALVLKSSRLVWLLSHWHQRGCVPLVSSATAAELMEVLHYKKFRLTANDRNEVLADYLPFCEIVALTRKCPITCRDLRDQAFLDLAHIGKADVLVSGDRDLLVLAEKTVFAIESPEAYRLRSQRG